MDARILFFLCVLQCSRVTCKVPSPQKYYGKHFLEFFTSMSQENIFLETIFGNMDAIKSTSEPCYRHLEIYRSSLGNNTYWALSYIDSFGSSLEPGWLTGNSINLGAFDECVSEKENAPFRGNYCWLNAKLAGDEDNRFWLSTKPNPIVFSICIPHTCSYEDVILLTKPLEKKLNITLGHKCQTARPSLTTTDYVSVSFFVIVALFTISTLLPEDWIPIHSTRLLEFWKCFDLNTNLRTLSSSKQDDKSLSSLYGIRFISQCCIVWYHVSYMEEYSLKPIQNKFYHHHLLGSWIGSFEAELNLAVDTFFMLGGTVLSYNCLKRKTKLNLMKYYLHRYLRLTPALLALVLFVGTFFDKLCSGPLCAIHCDVDKNLCATYWWSFFLYINNYFGYCLSHTWYLAADWQLFMFVSPFVVIAINKKRQLLYKLLALIFIVSLVYAASITFIFDITLGEFKSDEELFTYMTYYYKSPVLRAGPWIVGIFLGVFISDYRNKPKILSKLTIFFSWSVCAIILVFCTSFSRLLTTYHPNLWARVAFYTLNSNVFALAVAWIVFACSANIAGPIGMILSVPAFQPLGKLTYSMYLIHSNILYLITGDIRTPSFFSTIYEATLVLGLIVLSLFAALLLYLTFEAPFMHMDKLIFRKDKTSKMDPAALTTSKTNLTEESKVNYKSCQE